MLDRESQMLRVKRHGASHIFHVVTDTVDTFDERACVNVRRCNMRHGGDSFRLLTRQLQGDTRLAEASHISGCNSRPMATKDSVELFHDDPWRSGGLNEISVTR